MDVGNVYWVGKDEGLFALQTSVVSTSPGTPAPPASGLGVGGVFLVVVFLTDERKEGDFTALVELTDFKPASNPGCAWGEKSRGVKTSWRSCISSFSF